MHVDSASVCGVRGPRFESHRERLVVFIAMATAICSLGHGLRFTAVPKSTQLCIPSGSLNRVLASAGGKGGIITSAGWQVTLFDPIWHVSSRSGEAGLLTKGEPLYCIYLLLFTRSYQWGFLQHSCSTRWMTRCNRKCGCSVLTVSGTYNFLLVIAVITFVLQRFRHYHFLSSENLKSSSVWPQQFKVRGLLRSTVFF